MDQSHPRRAELNSSEESNPSSGTQGSNFSPPSSATNQVPELGPAIQSPDPQRPRLWTSTDGEGFRGSKNRHRRHRRLERSIELTAEQLRDLLLFIDANQDSTGIKWTSDYLFRYVPRTFETATVDEVAARCALEESIYHNLTRLVQFAIPSGYDSSSGRRVYELSYGEKDPVIPAALRDLPNLAFSKQPEYDIRPERYVESGSKISITEAYSLHLDDEAGFGTVGFAAVLEDNLGTRRHVLSTVGHVIDDASTINVQGADESKY